MGFTDTMRSQDTQFEVSRPQLSHNPLFRESMAHQWPLSTDTPVNRGLRTSSGELPDTRAERLGSDTTVVADEEKHELHRERTKVNDEETQMPLPTANQPVPPPAMSTASEIAFILIISMMQVIPMSTMSTVLPTAQIIADSFNITNPSLLPWPLAAYGLTFGSFILISGRLGDIFGHKRMVIIGFGWMAV